MTNEKHKSKLISLIDELMSEIDLKPLHPKNKILLYSRFVLSKLSWHFTVATISKTWIVENIDTGEQAHPKMAGSTYIWNTK